jgi:hypothetical protein
VRVRLTMANRDAPPRKFIFDESAAPLLPQRRCVLSTARKVLVEVRQPPLTLAQVRSVEASRPVKADCEELVTFECLHSLLRGKRDAEATNEPGSQTGKLIRHARRLPPRSRVLMRCPLGAPSSTESCRFAGVSESRRAH